VADLPEGVDVVEVNPLILHARGVTAVDAAVQAGSPRQAVLAS
jgi:succinyl-CoA synthetase beta subunit